MPLSLEQLKEIEERAELITQRLDNGLHISDSEIAVTCKQDIPSLLSYIRELQNVRQQTIKEVKEMVGASFHIFNTKSAERNIDMKCGYDWAKSDILSSLDNLSKE